MYQPYGRITASEVTDEQIAAQIQIYLSRPLAGEHCNRSLREAVALEFRCYNLQTRRVARVAWDLSQKGLIKVREIPGSFGLTLVRYSSVAR